MIKNATIAPSQPVLLILYLKLKALVSIYIFVKVLIADISNGITKVNGLKPYHEIRPLIM